MNPPVSPRGDAAIIPPGMSVADRIRMLAREHDVSYVPGPLDAWADKISELCGDYVELDHIELTLLALRRAGVITDQAKTWLLAAYLRSGERKFGASDTEPPFDASSGAL